jgi:imidazolonepropionase-like amidohydrolase
METLGARYDNAALLQKAGVLIALQSNDAHNARNLPYEAGLAVANGLSYEDALKALTVNPAQIFGINQLGSIEKEKRANIIIANGDPLEPKTVIEKVFIGGVEMPDTNYHKELWQEFQNRQREK